VTTLAASSGKHLHQVRRGETLTGLAKRYGVSVQALREANGMSAADALRAGVTLKIPG
jgi:membrane-bound lytic murein transglycosylase D